MEAESGWDFIPAKAVSGTMSDASMRQREEETPASYSGRVHGFHLPLPSMTNDALEVPKMPAGVRPLEDWGRNVISFGKYKGKRSYASLSTSVGKDDADYKKWLHAHYTDGSPQLRDLVEFLIAKKDRALVASGETQGVMIPGTDIPRRYVK